VGIEEYNATPAESRRVRRFAPLANWLYVYNLNTHVVRRALSVSFRPTTVLSHRPRTPRAVDPHEAFSQSSQPAYPAPAARTHAGTVSGQCIGRREEHSQHQWARRRSNECFGAARHFGAERGGALVWLLHVVSLSLLYAGWAPPLAGWAPPLAGWRSSSKRSPPVCAHASR